jgi:hypothetical protein
MTGDLTFIRGFAEGREWAVNWAGEEALQRIAGGSLTLEPDSMDRARSMARSTNRVLEELTTLIVNRSLPLPELRVFWKTALPDADSATLHDLQFLSGFLAGARYIAQEPV